MWSCRLTPSLEAHHTTLLKFCNQFMGMGPFSSLFSLLPWATSFFQLQIPNLDFWFLQVSHRVWWAQTTFSLWEFSLLHEIVLWYKNCRKLFFKSEISVDAKCLCILWQTKFIFHPAFWLSWCLPPYQFLWTFANARYSLVFNQLLLSDHLLSLIIFAILYIALSCFCCHFIR